MAVVLTHPVVVYKAGYIRRVVKRRHKDWAPELRKGPGRRKMVWRFVTTEETKIDKVIVTLLLPKGTCINRSLSDQLGVSMRKFRADQAQVIAITSPDRTKNYDESGPWRIASKDFMYRVGEIVKPDSFDPGPRECSNGIHFFRTWEAAVRWVG